MWPAVAAGCRGRAHEHDDEEDDDDEDDRDDEESSSAGRGESLVVGECACALARRLR